MEYGTDHAELYDLVFRSRGKDFRAEAQALAGLIRSRFPAADALLDVACGTGAHLETMAGLFRHVEGLEYAPAMRATARERLPHVTVHPGDMRDFDLGRRFDAVTCMGNAVGEVGSADELGASITRMAAHLVPGGVLVVEPWYFPENFIDGYLGGHLLREDDRIITRLTRSTRHGDKSKMEVRFVVVDREGFRDFTEDLVSSLFSRGRYEAAFEAAGCAVEFVPGFKLPDGRPNSPGLFVGVRK